MNDGVVAVSFAASDEESSGSTEEEHEGDTADDASEDVESKPTDKHQMMHMERVDLRQISQKSVHKVA